MFGCFDVPSPLDPGSFGGEIDYNQKGRKREIRSMVFSKSFTSWMKVPIVVERVVIFLVRPSKISVP